LLTDDLPLIARDFNLLSWKIYWSAFSSSNIQP